VARALARARAAGAAVVVSGPRQAARVAELERAADWGLGARPVREIAWVDLPVLAETASESEARRHALAGASLVLLRRGARPVAAIDATALALAPAESSMLARLERVGDRAAEARLWLLRAAGKLGESLGTPVHAVGGLVRDLLLGFVAPDGHAPDVDLVVEGDGIALARRLGEEIGGTVLVHAGFGTASIEGGRAPAGARLGRVDVASARRERYGAPGALPDVAPAGLLEDLRRRDFSINAMAVALAPDRFGHLIDPLGGQRDVKVRRLRALRPLAFVEDPTRIFRAARYAARLGLAVDRPTRAGIRLAVARRPYPALSGQRLWREVELMAAEPRARDGFELLVSWRAVTLLGAVNTANPQLADAERLDRWARAAGVAVDPAELYLVALLAGRPLAAIERCLDRLALSGEPRTRIEAGAALGGPLARRLEAARLSPSAVDETLRTGPGGAGLGAWLRGSARTRRRVEWYLAEGRAVQARLTGGDVLALGVPRGPDVGRALAMLRRKRLDGAAGSLAEERQLVKEWLTSGKEA
jgi:tRNA nucleotidyltransferase (CCA-adding enzyme)